MIRIDYEKCCWKDGKCVSSCCGDKCEGCVEVCPVGAFSREKQLVLDADKCLDCGLCMDACKHNALSQN